MTGNTKTSSFPGFDNLYKMVPKALGNMCFYADPDEKGTPHFELLRGEWKPDIPLQVHWAMGLSVPGDIARGRSTTWYYLSPRLQHLLIEHEVTGWTTYPIVLYNKANEVCPGYSGLSIIGRCGPIMRQRSVAEPGQIKKSNIERLMGMFFDQSSWNGSDFFCPAGVNAYIFATRKIKDLFELHQVKGFDFTPLSETVWIP